IDNQAVAVFTFHIDMPSLFNSPDFVTLVKAGQAHNPKPNTKPLSDDEIKTLGSQMATALKGLQISFSRYVGTTDKLPHGGSFDLSGTVNPTDFEAIKLPSSPLSPLNKGANSSSAPSGPINLDLHAKITLSGLGQKVDVKVPAGAIPFKFGNGAGSGG